MDDKQYQFNWAFRDYVTEDIVTIGIGHVWLYFYKESLIGVRRIVDVNKPNDTDELAGWWIKRPDTEAAPHMCPTFSRLREDHIQEAIMEVDFRGTPQRISMKELQERVRNMISDEASNA